MGDRHPAEKRKPSQQAQAPPTKRQRDAPQPQPQSQQLSQQQQRQQQIQAPRQQYQQDQRARHQQRQQAHAPAPAQPAPAPATQAPATQAPATLAPATLAPAIQTRAAQPQPHLQPNPQFHLDMTRWARQRDALAAFAGVVDHPEIRRTPTFHQIYPLYTHGENRVTYHECLERWVQGYQRNVEEGSIRDSVQMRRVLLMAKVVLKAFEN